MGESWWWGACDWHLLVGTEIKDSRPLPCECDFAERPEALPCCANFAVRMRPLPCHVIFAERSTSFAVHIQPLPCVLDFF